MARRRLIAVLVVFGVLAGSFPRLAMTLTESAPSLPTLTLEELALVGVWRLELHDNTEGENLWEFRADRSWVNTSWAGPGRSGEKSVETSGWSVRDGMLVVNVDGSDVGLLIMVYDTPRLHQPANPKAIGKPALAIAYVTAERLTTEGDCGARSMYARISSRQP
jgi:hypothetical protein